MARRRGGAGTARRRGRGQAGGGDPSGMPAWLLTFTDMMTLMLTFFVLLCSMAVIDETRKLTAMGSIIGTFGPATGSMEVLTREDSGRVVEPGPLEGVGDLAPLKDLVWDDKDKDLRFESNRFVQILSINADVLFAPGAAELTPAGRAFLGRLLPVLSRLSWPLLVAGHAAGGRDEGEEPNLFGPPRPTFDSSWALSLGRAQAVYRYLSEAGIAPDRLRLEAFGRYRPRFSQETPEGRSRNRRVDLVLDKREGGEPAALGASEPATPARPDVYDVNGFRFDLSGPGERPEENSGPTAPPRLPNPARGKP